MSEIYTKIGKILDGRYRIQKILSHGGFGVTFIAEDIKRPGNPICVVKQLHLDVYNPEVFEKAKELFKREAEALEELGEHPNIPRLLAYFHEDGDFYLVQEYIEGHTLRQELMTGKALPEDEVRKIVIELLKILCFVHKNNTIHRDIKPDNIIRRQKDNQLVLIDFGSVKQVTNQNDTIIGTPFYMPLEQLRGKPDFRSDIYAIGVIGIQAITGYHPKEMKSDLNEEYIWRGKANISSKFADILDKMIRPNYQERFDSSQQALEELQKIINPPPPPPWKIGIISIFIILVFIILARQLMPLVILFFTQDSKLPLNGELIRGNITQEDKYSEDDKLLIIPDPNLNRNKYYYDAYTFGLVRKQQGTIIIEVKSDDFDTYLRLNDIDGNKILDNDDISIDDSNSRLEFILPEKGIYRLLVSSSQPQETGNYTLKSYIKRK